MAANDDAPSIGGLIYALNEKPSQAPYTYASIATVVWGLLGLVFGWFQMSAEIGRGIGMAEILAKPTTFLVVAAVIVPMAVIWFLALLACRADELRLRSSTMTEVAVRLAEPDRMAEQSVASLGQAVRRQVSFMNDAVSRALGRAGELETLVHNEVAALERSYEENERKIRSLIQELSGERHALVDTGDRVTETLKSLGTEVPAIIEKLSNQQLKLAHIIQGAGENLTSLETAIDRSSGRLESQLGERTTKLQVVLEDYTRTLADTLGGRTEQMHGVLEQYTSALGSALGDRTDQMQVLLESYTGALATALSARAETLETVFEEYSRALDTTLTARTQALDTSLSARTQALDTSLSARTQALDMQLVERTRTLDSAFEDRLRLFDEAIVRSTQAIDSAVDQRARALTTALDAHARNFSDTISRQSGDLDESLMRGITAVRRSSENITRQSLKAIEGLAGQSDMLKNVSENLLSQISTVTGRLENQGQTIMRAANALETANYKIDQTLQSRHQDLNETLDKLSGKANEFGRVIENYSTSIEGTMSDAEIRARALSDELRSGTEIRKRLALEDLSKMKADADAESERALDDLRRRFSTVSNEVTRQLGSLTTQFDETSEEVRQHTARTAAELSAEQARLRQQIDAMPGTTRDSAEAMRRALQDQLKALDQLSTLTARTAQARDVAPPMPYPGNAPSNMAVTPPGDASRPGETGGRPLNSLSQTLAQELSGRARTPLQGMPTAGGDLHRSPQGALPSPLTPPAAGMASASGRSDGRDGWKLGELLARASLDEEHGGGAGAISQAGGYPQAPDGMGNSLPVPAGPFTLNVDVMARALDTTTASAIWARFRAGQRGIMVRSIYSAEGRSVFDETSRRYKVDGELQQTVARYLGEFERILRDADQRDPSGRLAQGHLVSDTGRVYLFLAHASGRLV